MKNKRTLTIAAVIVALAIIAAFGIFRSTTPVKAQDQIPPPVPDRISFGMVGITSGQTVRVSVSNTIMPNDANLPPGPTRVILNFRLPNGQLLRNRSGEVIRKAVDLERGDSVFLDVDFGALPPPVNDRIHLRAVIVALPPPVGDSTEQPPPIGELIASTVEVINNRDGRTQFAVFTNPAVIRGFNPQPDPPLGE
jgi:hypothetical protein